MYNNKFKKTFSQQQPPLKSIGLYYEKYSTLFTSRRDTFHDYDPIDRAIRPGRWDFHPDCAACIAGIFTAALSHGWLSVDTRVLGV
jgi:hypothetical protein